MARCATCVRKYAAHVERFAPPRSTGETALKFWREFFHRGAIDSPAQDRVESTHPGSGPGALPRLAESTQFLVPSSDRWTMNRLRTSTGPLSSAPVEPDFSVESALFEESGGQVSHTLFAPLHYEPGYAYPLIVWLHGRGNDERQLLRIMPLVSMRNYVAVAPRGPAGCGGASPGFTWPQSAQYVTRAEQVVAEVVSTASQKLHISPRRVFLAGFDCGGTMAFRLAMNRPDRYAGVASLGGAFPSGSMPFRNLTLARKLPLFAATGRDSTEYPASRVCEDLRLLHSAVMSISLRQYPCGHELSPQMLADLDRWIIEQITTPANAVAK